MLHESQMITLDSFYNICEDGVLHTPFGLHLTNLFSGRFISLFFPWLLLSDILELPLAWVWSPLRDIFISYFLALPKEHYTVASSRLADVGTCLSRPWVLPLAITSGAENRCLVQASQCTFWRSKENRESAALTPSRCPSRRCHGRDGTFVLTP